MQSVLYYLFATSFTLTAVGGVAMLIAPQPWLLLQKRLIAYIAPKPHGDAYLKAFEVVPVRVMGAVYMIFGSVALWLLTTGKFSFPIR